MAELHLTVNGVEHTVASPPLARLLDVLREELGLTGTKEGCGEGECGACAVLLDGTLVASCLVPVGQTAGCRIETVEGLAGGAELSALQQAFLDYGGAQCGICTPGMLMAARSLLARTPDPTEADVRVALAGNLCRCTGYTRIFEAVLAAAKGARGPREALPSGGPQRSGGPSR
jgi:carbon-monoxide dehydrogenase small subunit